MSYSPGISVVVPVYNSQGTLEALVRGVERVLSREQIDFEMILVNDCSRDNSWEVIQELCELYPWVYGVNLMRNFGQHNALLCGIRMARYDITVTMDDDLQHPPEEIIKLLDKLDEGYDVVYGTPKQEQHNLFRNLASQITKLVLQKAMGAKVARNISAFRVFRSIVTQSFSHYQSTFVSIDVLLTWGTTRFAAIPVRHEPRRIGVSNYTLSKLIVHTLNMMTGFSVLPLQLATYAGFGFTLFGFIVLIYVIGSYFIAGSSVQGFPFLASIIAIFSGAQLFSLGIIGEYLSRMFFRTMEKPPYVVRTQINQKQPLNPLILFEAEER